MSIRRKNNIRHYTIVEVMMAMGIFLVMMTIMMQFFTSAQKVWNLASKKNMLYADARVAMNLMTRELQSMLYDNDNDDTGIYPFWYQWTAIDVDGKTRTSVDEYFVTNNDLPENGGTGKPYLTVLNFISTTDLKPVDEGSDVCEIRYKFTPVYFDPATPASFNDVKGGKLERSCIPEYYDSTNMTPSADYNFSSYPYGNHDANRVTLIWNALSTSNDVIDFRTVITGVYSLRFTCFKWTTGTGLTLLDAIHDTTSPSGEIPGGGAPSGYDLVTGTPKPVAIRIDMKLMDPKDLKKLAYYIYLSKNGSTSEQNDAEKQIKILKQTMRTFSKVIYLGKDE